MSNVKQYNLLDENGIVINTIMLSDDSNWQIPEGHTLELIPEPVPEQVPEPEPQPQPILQLTQLNFLRRFTSQERITAKASNDPIIEDFMYLLTLAQDIRLDDQDTIAGVNYLEQQGILAEGRAAEILLPEYQ